MLTLRLVLAAAAAATVGVAARPAHAQSCAQGTVLLGAPLYKGNDKPDPDGIKLRGEPPLALRSLVMEGSRIFTNTAQEIWLADLRGDNIKRIAGEEQTGYGKLKDGPCKDARFINIHGMVEVSDGSLVVADYMGHALLKITDPSDDKCAVSYLAGTNVPSTREGTKGDEDGPAKTAKITNPLWPAADDDGTIYFVDEGGNELKKVAADADHTVSTVAKLKDLRGYGYTGLTYLGEKLYLVGNTFSTTMIFEVDPKSGEVRKVLESGAKPFAPLDSSTVPTLSSVTNDGSALIVSGQGYIWRVTTAGKVTHLAGNGSPLDVPRGYDLNASYPAKKLYLRFRNGDLSTMGTTTALAYQNGVIFWRGRADGSYVVTIRCK